MTKNCETHSRTVRVGRSDFSTLYTLMKLAQKISELMGQRDSLITFDLDLYAKAKQLQIRYPNELKNTVIRMGGFHIALNYLALLGKKNARAGLADLLIESGVCVAGITSVLMLGKCTTGGFVPTSSAWKHYLGFCGRRSWNGCRSKTMAWTTGQSTLLSTEVVIAEPH